jgi:nitrogen regulatory protein PII
MSDSDELWLVVAFIQPFKLDDVTLALQRVQGFSGMTVSECRGFGREKMEDLNAASASHGDGASAVIDFTQKVRLEVAVPTRAVAQSVVDAIGRAAHTGRRGDGKIIAWRIDRAIRIRTLDEDARAL